MSKRRFNVWFKDAPHPVEMSEKALKRLIKTRVFDNHPIVRYSIVEPDSSLGAAEVPGFATCDRD